MLSFNTIVTNCQESPFWLENESAYLAWKEKKLANYPQSIEDLEVEIKNIYQLTATEKTALRERIGKTNWVIYRLPEGMTVDKAGLQALGAQLGLVEIDRTLTAEEDGITALQVESTGERQEYIPYSDKPINWHTDGYYNPSDKPVRGLLMHCVRPAQSGGENQLLDNEIAYIHLRDHNPDNVAALMQPAVMTIPANVQAEVVVRDAQTGPVFSIEHNGTLYMRYTARRRNIIWQDSPQVTQAVSALQQIFIESPYVFQCRLQANQGIICNNVLHNRSGFTDSDDLSQKRLLYRIRYYERVN